MQIIEEAFMPKEKRGDIVGKVIQYIRKNIEEGEWPLGTKIPSENELCRTLNVSRSSVRTALQRFIVLGILESQQGRGTFVCSVNTNAIGKGYVEGGRSIPTEEVAQWAQARFSIEPLVAYQVAKIATPEMIRQLEDMNQALIGSVGNPAQFVHYDMMFHKTLVDLLENSILSRFLYELLDERAEVHIQNNESFGYYGGIHYHVLITNAIKEHNPTRALNLMLEHGYSNMKDLEFEGGNGIEVGNPEEGAQV